MGIYLQTFAKRGWLPSGNMPQKLADAARSWAESAGLASLFSAEVSGDVAYISIYPPAGSIEFNVRPDRVDFGAKTSMAGPGYHAALVELCDWLQQKLDLKWRWDADGDGSGYARARDRAALETAFIEQLHANFRHMVDVLEPEGAGAINIPADLGCNENGKISTPIGSLPFSAVAALAASDEKEIGAFASTFYPWWRDRTGDEFWTGTLRAMLWAEVEWRPAATDWERYHHAAAKAAFAAIRNPPQDLNEAMIELRTCIVGKKPAEGGIGYRRQLRRFSLPGSWWIKAPGYFVEELEDNGNCVCVWTIGEEVRGTSLTIEPKDNAQPLPWMSALRDCPDQHFCDMVYRIANKADPASAAGYRIAYAECVVRRADGVLELLILSLTSTADEPALLARLQEYADTAVYQPPPSANERGDA